MGRDFLDRVLDLPQFIANTIFDKNVKLANDKVFSLDSLFLEAKRTNPFGQAFSYINKSDILLDKMDGNRHTLVCAKTGAGKTELMYQLIDEKLSSNRPIIFIDGKGSTQTLKKFYSLNKHYKRKCYVMSNKVKNSIKCNPVYEGDITSIVDRIMTSFKFENPYYRSSNRRALTESMKLLKKHGYKPSLENILSGIVSSSAKDKDAYSDIVNKLSAVVNSSFGELVNETESPFVFSRIRNEKASIYIDVSTLGYPDIATAIGNLFIQELSFLTHEVLSYETSEKIKRHPLSCIIDEFGTLGTENTISLINKCREANLDLTLLVQTISDLDEINGDVYRKRIIGNMDNFYIGTTVNPEEADLLANIIGTDTSISSTHVIEDLLETGMGTFKEVYEYKIHPSVFKNLGVGQFVIKNIFPSNYIDVIKLYQKKFDYEHFFDLEITSFEEKEKDENTSQISFNDVKKSPKRVKQTKTKEDVEERKGVLPQHVVVKPVKVVASKTSEEISVELRKYITGDYECKSDASSSNKEKISFRI